MKNLGKIFILAMVAFVINACGVAQDSSKGANLALDSNATSSDWEVLELNRKYSDDDIMKFAICYAVSGEKCDEKIKEMKIIKDSCVSGVQKYCVIKHIYYRAVDSLYDESLEVLRKSCDSDYGTACAWLGWAILRDWQFAGYIKKDSQKGMQYLQKACDLGSANGCSWLAQVYAGEELFAPNGIARDNDKALLYIDKAIAITKRDCEKGIKIACE